MLLRVSVLVLVVYGGLLVPDLLGLHAHADGLHPVAGHGLPAGQRAAARRGLAGADPRRSMDQIEKIALRDAGRQARHRRSPASRSLLSANGSNFGSMFVILDDFDERARSGAVQRRHRRHSCGSSSAAEVPEAMVARLRPAAGARRGPGRRLQAHDRGPRRPRPGSAAEADRQPRSTQGNKQPRPDAACSPSSGPTSPQLYVDVEPRRSA